MYDFFNHKDNVLDTRGLWCPEPIIMIRQAMHCMDVNQTLLVIADDPATAYDIPSFCEFTHHRLLAQHIEKYNYRYLLLKQNFPKN